jgi:hypothetical protein
MNVWDALGMNDWRWAAVGTQPIGILVWVQDHAGMMDLAIWWGDRWDFKNGNLRSEPTHWRGIHEEKTT